jgi:hypothetical protein
MSETKHWIVKIVPSLAFAAGIIMSSIGGIMTLSSGSKLLLFDHGPYGQVTREQCEFDYRGYGPIPLSIEKVDVSDTKFINTLPRKRTEDEIIKCVNEKRREEKQRFQQDKKQNLVDGLSVLIVGLLLILFFRKK